AGGRVSVNGIRVTAPGLRVHPGKDILRLDGRILKRKESLYVALHKPPGVPTTRRDERGRKTVFDILPPPLRGLIAAGRLDLETGGLLLLTNDTRFGDLVTSPASRIPKTYHAGLDRPLGEKDRAALESGMRLADGTPLRPADVEVPGRDARTVVITVTEGKNRQVRRMFDTLGYAVLSLKRVRVGSVLLGDLPPGAVRRLSPEEVRALLHRAGRQPRSRQGITADRNGRKRQWRP
ncbi:MAG: pseudouridine synthase, partial [Bacteroidota bacterium]